MSVDRILALKLVTDVGNIDKKVSGVQGRIAGLGRTLTSFAKAGGLGLALGAVDAIGSALAQGVGDFRASERAGANLARTWDKLGLKGDDLGKTVDDISGKAIELGFDDTESVEAFDRLLKKTKDVDTSQRLLAAAWDLARAKQIPLEQAVGEVTKLYDGSSKALKQYGLEGVSGLAAVDAAMATNTGAAAAFAASSEGRWTVLQGKIGEVFETIAGAGLGLLDSVLPALTSVGDTLGKLWTDNEPQITALVSTIADKLGAAIASVSALVTALAPHFANMISIVEPAIKAFGDTVFGALDIVRGILDTITALLNGDFQGAWDAAQATVQSVVDTIASVVGGIADTISNVVSAVGPAAADVASSIFDGLVDGLAGLGKAVTDAIVGGIRSGLNALIGIWNGLELPGFTIHIPDISIPNPLHGTVLDPVGKPHIPVIGASDFQLWGKLALPNIPRLAEGGIVSATRGGILARIGEGRYDEAVVPLDGRPMGGNHYTVNVYIAPGGDMREAGRQTVAAIRAYEAVEGKQWRA